MATVITALPNASIQQVTINDAVNTTNTNNPHNQLDANINANKSSIDSLDTNKVEIDDVIEARGTIGSIPKRKADGNTLDVDIDGNADTVDGKHVNSAKVADTIPVRDGLGSINTDVTGNVTGDLTGNVTGNVTGDVTGNSSSATTLSAGADRNTLDGLGNSSTKDVGTTSGTVAAGDHSHGLGNSSTKDVGTTSGTVAAGDHSHSGMFDLDGVLTKMMFMNWPLPNGWTIDTTVNDKTILLTNSSASVGDTGGSWTITGFSAAGSHSHTMTDSDSNRQFPSSTLTSDYISNEDHKHTIYSAGSHTHSSNGSWRPSYKKSCVGKIDKR